MHLSSYHVSLEKTDFESKKKATLYNKELAVDFVCTQTEHGCLAPCLNTIVPPPHSPAGRLMIWVHVRIIFSQLFSLSLPLLGSLYVDCRGSGGVETAGSDPAAPRGTGMLEGEMENFASQKDQI